MNKDLTWRELKALNQLYRVGETKAKIQNNNYIKNILKKDRKFIEPKFGKKSILIVNENRKTEFNNLYETEFLDNYNSYNSFLKQLGEKVGNKTRFIKYSRLKEYEIKQLIEINRIWTIEKFNELKQQIENARENLQGVSRMFFKSPKYIYNSKNRQSLEVAIKALIGIEKFYENDKQYLYILHCKSRKPKAIILCENLYFLKLPHYADDNNIELWYAGGNNIKKLEKIPEIKYPIFYLCDWDYHGLKIYERVKDKMNNIENKQFDIKLITPNGKPKGIKETEENHSSKWLSNLKLSGLNELDYSIKQKQQIQLLIDKDNWIEEEDNEFNDLIDMYIK